mgnify:CR=1 FL=1
MNWMIYGATGFTGRIAVREAVAQGLEPVIAGRNEAKLAAIAGQHGLRHVSFPIDSSESIAKHLRGNEIQLVLNLAGPYAYTGAPMIRACLEAGCHYLDITGEPNVFHDAYSMHEQALQKGVAIMPGVGFDILPSDCMIKYVVDQISEATDVVMAFDFRGETLSRGALKRGLEMVAANGNLIRRGGELIPIPFASESRMVHFLKGEAKAKLCMWGDVISGYRTTGAPNIATFFAFDRPIERQFALLHRLRPLLRFGFVRKFLSKQLEREPEGPSKELQNTARVDLYAKASDNQGRTAEVWLQTCEGYLFTARACIYAAKRVLNENLAGALTPSIAFGRDSVLEIEGTIRRDSIAANTPATNPESSRLQ